MRPSWTGRRGHQLRHVGEENRTRQAAVLDIGQLRDRGGGARPKKRRASERTEETKLLAEVEAEFIGKGAIGRDSVRSRWRYPASRSIPNVRNARLLWERAERDPVR